MPGLLDGYGGPVAHGSVSVTAISASVSAERGGAPGAVLLIIVVQKMRQLRMQNTAISFASRSAVRSLAVSTRQPDFRILWNSSIFQRWAYHRNFSTASSGEATARSVASFQSTRSRPRGRVASRAWITVRSRAG